jgi:pimeloyl-ACP methyl ester carboxylesterase
VESKFFNIACIGQTWRYFKLGNGHQDVVLVHGFPDTPQSWWDIATALAEFGYRVTVPYLWGYHPDTLVPGRSLKAAEIGEDVIGLMDALEIEEAVLVGHDWGASCV